MALEDDIQLLQKISMFSDFEPEHLRLIAFGSQKLSFHKDHVLYHQGQATDGGYIILYGLVHLVVVDDGEQKLLGEFGQGSLLGEMALISANKRIGTAIVHEDCEVMKVSRIMMHRILNEYPELAVSLKKRICASVLQFTQELEKVRI